MERLAAEDVSEPGAIDAFVPSFRPRRRPTRDNVTVASQDFLDNSFSTHP
jgi:hypothetical protein